MPIYEYQCGACGHKLEKLQKMADDPLRDCPECSEASLTKLVSAAAFRLKGVGWYETDFKTGSKRNLVEDTKSEQSASESDSSKGSSSSSSKDQPSSDDKKPSDKGTAKTASGKTDSVK